MEEIKMPGLPSKYAKMGFKKGWAAFNKKRVHVKRRIKMAKHRKVGKRGMMKGLTGGNIIKILTGAALSALYEVFVSPMIPIGQITKNIIEMVVGIILAAMPGVPMPIKAFGAALATINAYSIILNYIPALQSGEAASSW